MKRARGAMRRDRTSRRRRSTDAPDPTALTTPSGVNDDGEIAPPATPTTTTSTSAKERVRLLGEDHLTGLPRTGDPAPRDHRVGRTAGDARQGEDHADHLAGAGRRVVEDDGHPADGDQREGDEARRDPLVQEPAGQEQDHQGLERPQEHRQARGDRGEPEQAQRVGCPGLRRPSRPSSGDPSLRNEIPWRRMSTPRITRLTASWIGSSVSGGTSSSAALLMTVPTPQQVAARTSATRSRRATGDGGHDAAPRRDQQQPVPPQQPASATGRSRGAARSISGRASAGLLALMIALIIPSATGATG